MTEVKHNSQLHYSYVTIMLLQEHHLAKFLLLIEGSQCEKNTV